MSTRPRSVHLRLLALPGPLRRLLVGPFLLGLVNSLLLLAQAWATSRIFVALFASPVQPISQWLMVLLLLLLLRPAVILLRERISVAAMTRIKEDLRARVLERLTARGPIALTRERSGHIQSLLVDGVENLDPYWSRYIPQIGIVAINTVVVVGLLATVDVPTAVAVGTCAVLVPLLPRLWDRVLSRRGSEHWSAYSGLHAEFVDSIRAMTTLKALGAVERRQRSLADSSQNLLARTMDQLKVSLIESGLSAFALVLGPLVAITVAWLRIRQGALQPTDVFLLGLLTFEVFRPFKELSGHWHAGYLGIFAGEQIMATLTASTLPRPERSAALPTTRGLSVQLSAVGYRYPGSDRPALTGLDLLVPAGDTLAVVGPSGSGKSTIAALLARFALPDTGEVLLGGVSTRDLDHRSCAAGVTLAAQDPVLFHGTLRDNLLMARPTADAAALAEVIALTGLAQLGGGDPVRALDRPIGERGNLLSGGQRQRVAIARALLRDTPVLVLDEATSALDVHAERTLLDALSAARPQQTLLVVAHRLAAIRALPIAVVQDGVVVERGDHLDLMARDGVYADMVRHQDRTATGHTDLIHGQGVR